MVATNSRAKSPPRLAEVAVSLKPDTAFPIATVLERSTENQLSATKNRGAEVRLAKNSTAVSTEVTVHSTLSAKIESRAGRANPA